MPEIYQNMLISLSRYKIFLLLFIFLIIACETDEESIEPLPEVVEEPEISPEKLLKIFQNKSLIDPLVDIDEGFSSLEAYSMVSTADTLGGNFRIGGTADGAGFLNDEENFIYVVNFESDRSIGRIKFDEYLNPVSGDYLLDRGVADYARQCSATMWEAAIHGGDKDIFLSASE